jgi:hypothetical protein
VYRSARYRLVRREAHRLEELKRKLAVAQHHFGPGAEWR